MEDDREKSQIFGEKFNPYRMTWDEFYEKLENYFKLQNIDDEVLKRNVLLNNISESARSILCSSFRNMTLEFYSYKYLVRIFHDKYDDIQQGFFARSLFYNARKLPEESLYQWRMKVKHLAEKCNYDDSYHTIIKDKFIMGLDDECLKIKLYNNADVEMSFMEIFDLALVESAKLTEARNVNLEIKDPPPRPSEPKPVKHLKQVDDDVDDDETEHIYEDIDTAKNTSPVPKDNTDAGVDQSKNMFHHDEECSAFVKYTRTSSIKSYTESESESESESVQTKSYIDSVNASKIKKFDRKFNKSLLYFQKKLKAIESNRDNAKASKDSSKKNIKNVFSKAKAPFTRNFFRRGNKLLKTMPKTPTNSESSTPQPEESISKTVKPSSKGDPFYFYDAFENERKLMRLKADSSKSILSDTTDEGQTLEEKPSTSGISSCKCFNTENASANICICAKSTRSSVDDSSSTEETQETLANDTSSSTDDEFYDNIKIQETVTNIYTKTFLEKYSFKPMHPAPYYKDQSDVALIEKSSLSDDTTPVANTSKANMDEPGNLISYHLKKKQIL